MLVKSIKIHLIPQILILLLTALHFRTKLIFLTYYLPPTTYIDVSVDNALLATASEDGDCRIWGLQDESPIAILRGHIGGVTMVSFSLTTPYQLTTTAEDGFARLWDVREAAMKRYVSVVQSLRKYFEGKISEQHKIMEQQCKEREAQAKQTAEKNLSAEYSRQVAKLQEQLLAEKEGHKDQLKRLDDEQRSEIDELIQQLDDVELEQESKYKDLQQWVNEKKTIISVLSSQLVEANAVARRMDQKRLHFILSGFINNIIYSSLCHDLNKL
jgi:hypothetical protein